MKCEIYNIREVEWYIWYLNKYVCNECRLKLREKTKINVI